MESISPFVDEIIIPCFDAIRKHNTTVDQELQEFAEGELDELAAFASIYTSVLLHTYQNLMK